MFDSIFPKHWTTLQRLMWLKTNALARAVYETLGPAPIVSFTALRSAPLKSLTQYGKCETVSGDVYCNNGKLTAADDELPSAYKRLLGFSMNNNSYWVITDFKLKGSDTIRFSFAGKQSVNVLGCYNGTSATDNYSLYTVGSPSGGYLRYGGDTYNSYVIADKRYDVELTPTGSKGMEKTSTWSAKTFTSTADMCIGTTSTTATSSKFVGSLFGDIVVDERLHLVPCERVSDNALGYYDLIGEAFYEQGSTYNGAVSLGYDTSHLNVLPVEGTPEVLTVTGKNLLNVATNTTGSYISATGVITEDGTGGVKSQYSALIPVTPGEKYTWSLISNRTSSGNDRWHGYDANGDWAEQVAFDSAGTGGEAFTLTATIPNGVYYVRLSYGINDTNAMLEHGESATEYEAYTTQTATVPDLFASGDAADEVDIINGKVTRNVEVTVPGGTITISPLAEPVTESVTPQPLNTTEGTNTVSAVTEVDPVMLTVTYRSN